MKKILDHTEVDREAGASAFVLIRFEPGKASVRRALRLLTKCALEVVVAAREAQGVHAPEPEKAKRCATCGAEETCHPYRHPFKTHTFGSREAEGSRWNG